jgi:hypothetical protein
LGILLIKVNVPHLELSWFSPPQVVELNGLLTGIFLLVLDAENLDEVGEWVAVLPRAAGGGGRLLSLTQNFILVLYTVTSAAEPEPKTEEAALFWWSRSRSSNAPVYNVIFPIHSKLFELFESWC